MYAVFNNTTLDGVGFVVPCTWRLLQYVIILEHEWRKIVFTCLEKFYHISKFSYLYDVRHNRDFRELWRN